jgi:putative PIN family toxin of toxin-antitoxin system
VWVSALINPYGAPARVVETVTDGEIVAVVTQHLLDELTAVLIRPKFRRWVNVADATAFVEALGGHAEIHPDPAIRHHGCVTQMMITSSHLPRPPMPSSSPAMPT